MGEGFAGVRRAAGFVSRVRRRARQRRVAAGQLVTLAGRAGWPLVVATCVLHTVAGLLPVVFLVCMGRALEGLAGTADVTGWMAAALGAFLVQQVLAPLQFLASQRIRRRVDRYCLGRFTRFALTSTPLRTLERAEVADRLSQANQAFEEMAVTPGAAAEGGLALVARYAQLVGAVAVVGVTVGSWPAVAAALVAVVNRRGQSSAFYRWGQLVRAFAPARRRMGYIRDLATGTRAAKEIRTLGLIDWIDERYQHESRALLHPLWTWRRRVYGAPFAAYALLGVVGAAVALFAVAHMGSVDTVPIGRLTMAAQAVLVCIRFGGYFEESDTKMVYGRGVWEALLEFEAICRAVAGTSPRKTEPVPSPLPVVAFSDVGFAYEPDRPVLRDLDLRLAPGKSTALVGVNGAGKTTLVKLLTGLYDPTDGRITVGGTDLATIDAQAWRAHFAVTLQDYVRYELSLRDNVSMGAIANRDDDDGIRAELARVGLGELAASLPAGLDTPLTRAAPGGRELSGGQWQRLALARSLFAVRHGACVLVLDEPTAQLDARGEAEFYDTFLDLTRGVTSLIISHRFSSVRRADQIVVLDGGRITESGSHDELMAAGGTYATLFAAQASRFVHVGEAA